MLRTSLALFLFLSIAASAFGASGHHTLVTYDRSGTPTEQTDIFSDGRNLWIKNRGFDHSATAAEAAGTGNVETSVELGAEQDSLLYVARDKKVMMIEAGSKDCRTFSPETASAKGAPSNTMPDMSQYQKIMGENMAKVKEAMAGLSDEEQKAVAPFLKGLENMAEPEGLASKVVKMNKTTKIGNFTAEGYEIRDARNNVEQILWVIPENKAPGAAAIGTASREFYGMIEETMKGFGLPGALSASILKELDGLYPVGTDNPADGSYSRLTEARGSDGGTSYSSDCRPVGMFGR